LDKDETCSVDLRAKTMASREDGSMVMLDAARRYLISPLGFLSVQVSMTVRDECGPLPTTDTWLE